VEVISNRTKYAKPSEIEHKWLVVDATEQVLGRLASQVAYHLRGKHKPYYTPSVDCGDHVIVINADKIRLTGAKWTDKEYITHTGYPGGQRIKKAKDIHAKHPTRLVESAIRRMLPKNKLGSRMFNHLHVYAGDEHPHEAQQPKELKVK